MTYYRVWSKANRQQLAIERLYSGASAFLVGANPRLLDLDLRLMKMPGVLSMGINNAAIVLEPDMFIALDRAECFNYNIFTNPRVMKFMSTGFITNIVEGQRVCNFPNTIFFDRDDSITVHNFCKREGPLVSWRNTFFTALHCLYQLGFANIYLIGCVFQVDKDNQYAYDHKLEKKYIDINESTYDKAVNTLKELAPNMKDDGVRLMTCHDKTSLDGIIEYLPFEEAIGEVVRESGSIKENRIVHANEER